MVVTNFKRLLQVPFFQSKKVSLVLKIIVTCLCLWYISGKVNWGSAWLMVRQASWSLLAAATLVYALSKVVAALRLNIYFKNMRLRLAVADNLRLYWLGMFYNLFLPGSISGDAYKVVVLHRMRQAPLKKTSAAVLLDRLSGLLGLGLLLVIYSCIVLREHWLVTVISGGYLISVPAFYFVIKRFFCDFLQSFWRTLFLGFLVQAIQVAGVYLILAALHVQVDQQQWLFIFLAASVVSVLPLSLGGGLGTREVIFAEGAAYFHLDTHFAVVVSLLFYLTSVAAALPGAWFIFSHPLKGIEERS